MVDAERRVVGILTDGDLLARLDLPDASLQRALTEAELNRELALLRDSGQTVADLMVSPVITVTEDTPIADAVRVMTERGIKRLPVVDHKGKLVGMVSRVDVLRALAQPPMREASERTPQPGTHAKVADVMLTQVQTVRSDAKLNKIVELLVSTAERRVVVVDAQRHVLGIITDGDLLKRATADERAGILQALGRRRPGSRPAALALAGRTADAVMTAQPVTVTAETPLLEALRLLLQHKVKRLPVVDSEGRLVGLVGRGQILQALAQALPRV